MFGFIKKQFKFQGLLMSIFLIIFFGMYFSLNNNKIGADILKIEPFLDDVLIDNNLVEIKDDIRHAEVILESEKNDDGIDILTNDVVYYLYKTDKNVEDEKNEIVAERGYNYKVYNINGKKQYQFHGTAKYEKIDNKWKQLEWATSTKDVYEKSLDIDIVSKIKNKLFAGTALADTFYPVATGDNSECKSGTVWATIRDGTSGTARNGNTCYLQNYKSGGTIYIERAQLAFDTSNLADDCSISSATLSFNGDWTRGVIDNHYFNVYDENGDDTTPDADDYNDCGTTVYSDTGIDNDEWSTAAGRNNIYTLNTSGKSAISVSGNSFFCVRGQTYDAENVEPTDNLADGVGFASVRTSGDTDDPLLTVTCSAGGTTEERRKASQPGFIIY